MIVRPNVVTDLTPTSARAGGFILETVAELNAPREAVFAFFADAFNLERITPPNLRFRVLTPRPIEMRAGAIIDYRLSLHGLPMAWKTEISAWEPAVRFVDEALKSSYRWWHHEHRFEDLPCARTKMTDIVHYGVPLAWASHALFVRPSLRRIFEYRTAQFESIFPAR